MKPATFCLLALLLPCLCSADSLRSSLLTNAATDSLKAGSEASPKVWHDSSDGIRLRGAIFAIARPTILSVFSQSDGGFNPEDETQLSSSASSFDTNQGKSSDDFFSEEAGSQGVNLSASELKPNKGSVSLISDLSASGSVFSDSIGDVQASDSEEKAQVFAGSSSSENVARGEEGNVNPATLEGADTTEMKYNEFDSYSVPQFFLVRKMFLPFGPSSTFFGPSLSDPWERVRTMELKKLREASTEESLDDKLGEQRVEKNEVYDNGDGTFTVHRTISYPHNKMSFEVSTNKFLDDAASNINGVTTRVKTGFLSPLLDAFDSFYNSTYGSIILGIGCGLVLAMISFLIMSLLFPEENDEEKTVFILSTDTPSTPLLEENPSSDSDSVSSGQNSPRAVNYHPPNVDN